MKSGFMKHAWIRDQDAPPGRPAKGHIGCPCRNAPWTDYNASQGDVRCNCGALYTWNGWIIEPSPTTK